MKVLLFIFIVFTCLCLVSFGSIPSRNTLRFNEVNGNTLGPNSVSNEDLQEFSIDRNDFLNGAVYQSKMGPLAINAEQVAPGAITSSGASLDLVTLFIRNDQTVPAESQNNAVQMPENEQAVQPYEAIRDVFQVIVDEPDSDFSYRVEGKARGSGVILGWYPSQNGHLLRYQSSRALRGIVCSAIDVANIDRNDDCRCNNEVTQGADGDLVTVDCDCVIDIAFNDVDFASDIGGCSECTVLDCNGDNVMDADPQCVAGSSDPRLNPFDDTGDHLPDRCNPYTSVADVTNPQEGVPVYSPSIERITIDDTGRVEMWFFGRGTVDGPHDDIEITVVVLLDEQYGA